MYPNIIKYYSPITDVTFHRIFGKNIDLAASLLNAFLPLEEGRKVESLEYISPELMPETPARKNSIVDVCCRDSSGVQFLVEMQINWPEDFYQRVLFNASKAYVNQLGKGRTYKMLQPVYSLNFVNGNSHPGLTEWYHPYRIVHQYHSDLVIEGLHIVFAEMDKYRKLNVKGNSKRDLWMRYFTELTENTRKPAEDLLADPEVGKAIELLEAINYSEEERYLYDRYWDAVSIEATLRDAGIQEGMERGMAKGIERGIVIGVEQGVQQGIQQERHQLVLKMLNKGLPPSLVAEVTGLTEEEVINY
ncbi:MAG: Rpn family recombination-promoting nuclease/putative transposase [Bacteroidales bacterium]|nr:Rpn family recombination-promoting nuclease/putative transposase [Bacteroidales bacterium]